MESVTITVGPPVYTLDQIREAFFKIFDSNYCSSVDLLAEFEELLLRTPVSVPTPFFEGEATAQGRFSYTVYRTTDKDEGWTG